MIASVLLDFDGVVVDSIGIKKEAFLYLFRAYPEGIRRRIEQLHIDNPGLTRYKKFEIIYKVFLGKAITEGQMKKLGEDFSRFCLEKIIKVPYIQGAYEFISRQSSVYDLYIVSAVPEAELNEIVKRRKIDHFFKGVFGAPAKKADICRSILNQGGYSPAEVVFVGDALSDFEAAHECGLHFIAKRNEQNPSLFSRCKLKFEIDDLCSLLEIVKTMV